MCSHTLTGTTLKVTLAEQFHSSHCTTMTGRGRARRDKSPDTKCAKRKTRPEEMKELSLPTRPGKYFSEERQNGTTKEQKPKEQKKTNNTAEKPSVQSTRKEMTTKHFTEEIIKQQRTDTDKKNAPVQGTEVKTCAGRAKTTEQSAGAIAKTQPPKDTTNDSLPVTKAKRCAGKAKSPQQLAEETIKIKPETPKVPTEASIKPKNTKRRPGKAKSPERDTDGTTKMQQETLKDTKKACVAKDRYEDKAAVDSILYTTLEKLKIRKNHRSDAAVVVNEIVKNIRMHLKQKTECFKEVEDSLHTGSYYENLKVSHFSSQTSSWFKSWCLTQWYFCVYRFPIPMNLMS